MFRLHPVFNNVELNYAFIVCLFYSMFKCSPGRAPKRPLVCVPCKKRFTCRSKLDQHNRLVHNTDIRYSCAECSKTFSRRDHIARHVKHGHCTKQSRQAAAEMELSVNNEDTRLLVEIRTSVCTVTEPQCLMSDSSFRSNLCCFFLFSDNFRKI